MGISTIIFFYSHEHIGFALIANSAQHRMRGKPPLRTCLDQIGLWVCLGWEISWSLIDSGVLRHLCVALFLSRWLWSEHWQILIPWGESQQEVFLLGSCHKVLPSLSDGLWLGNVSLINPFLTKLILVALSQQWNEIRIAGLSISCIFFSFVISIL